MSNHTPGPWHVRNNITNPDPAQQGKARLLSIETEEYEGDICGLWSAGGSHIFTERQKANANLIAAAPTMINALCATYLSCVQSNRAFRATSAGQSMLIDLRDAIAAAYNVKGEQVQNTFSDASIQLQTGELKESDALEYCQRALVSQC